MSAGDRWAYTPIHELQGLLRSGELTSVELVESALGRADAISEWNAFITPLRDDALRAAHRADQHREDGASLPALHGIPITAKDIVHSGGVRTTSGSLVDQDFVPATDAPCLARLKSSGAILIGKTNLHEFAYGVTSINPHYGTARNPWAPDRVSGGSSGGSAVALAAGVGYGSIGTDTGGSIRIPSALCGVVGLKPTYDRIPRDGVTALSWSLDHIGPMARTVSDLAVLFDAMANPHPAGESAVEALASRPSSLRIGCLRTPFWKQLDPEVELSVDRAVESLAAEFQTPVHDLELPEAQHQVACRNTIAYPEAASYHAPRLARASARYSAGTLELLRLGQLVPATDYLAALRQRRAITAAYLRLFDEVDVLIAPTTPAPAPRIVDTKLSNGEDIRAGLLRLAGPFNLNGLPALSIPCGLSSDGLPLAMQLIGPPYQEALLCQVGSLYESIRGPMKWPDLP